MLLLGDLIKTDGFEIVVDVDRSKRQGRIIAVFVCLVIGCYEQGFFQPQIVTIDTICVYAVYLFKGILKLLSFMHGNRNKQIAETSIVDKEDLALRIIINNAIIQFEISTLGFDKIVLGDTYQ